MSFFKSTPKAIQGFWVWFAQNAHDYERLSEDPQVDKKLDAICRRLDRVDNRLTCEFMASDSDVSEIVISVDGVRSAFSLVEQVVADAPQISNWNVIAFRQRGGVECTISFNGLELGPDNIWFRLRGNDAKVGIQLFFKTDPDDQVKGATFILLDNALGEFTMGTKVGNIDWLPLTDVEGLKPFAELPAAFDAFYNLTQSR